MPFERVSSSYDPDAWNSAAVGSRRTRRRRLGAHLAHVGRGGPQAALPGASAAALATAASSASAAAAATATIRHGQRAEAEALLLRLQREQRQGQEPRGRW